ncbi:MAG: peptidylprolyl isomerase [Cytophagaceae bacterium]|nr:peptidylprolyl isomerase [Cytophagaceae bacterium]
MKKAGFALLLSIPALQPVFSQSQTVAPTDPVLLTIGGKPVTVSEFTQSYTRHQFTTDSLSEANGPRPYLDLFINYKLKVRAAEARGLDTTQAFREELATYRQQSVQSYLTDKAATDAVIREAYERMNEEISAAHILISVAADAAPTDTLAAYNEALALRDRALKGEDFGQLAKANSQDPTAAQSDGNLGWFSALQMVYPFENAAYRTEKGKISMPIRTKFGYHVIKVADRRASQGKVRVAHILVKMTSNAPDADQTVAKNRIDEAYAALQRNEPFDRVVKQFTDDASSRNAGGVLPPFGSGAMIQAFETAAFALKKVGAYSAPFQTTYGWHIVKLIERIPLEDYEKLSGTLRQRVLVDGRSSLGKQVTLTRIKRENGFTENPATLNDVLTTADARLVEGKWNADANGTMADRPLFSIGKEPVPVRNFFAFIQKQQQAQPGGEPKALMRKLYSQFVEQENFRYEEAHLEEKNPEFRALVQEFHDGILLFQVMENDVLNKALEDSTGQRAFYERNKTKYLMPESATATIMSAASKDILDQARTMLAKQPYAINRRVPELYFEKGQMTITDPHREQLFDLLVILAKNPAYQVEITGNADTSEDDSVSAIRTRNVVRYLTSGGGISQTRIVEIDEGKFKPVSATNRDKNRRVGFLFSSTAKQDVAVRFNQQKTDNLVIREGTFKKGDERILDAAAWKPGRQTLERSGRTVQIDIERVEPARPKTFAEARGAVINDYQADLERQWLANLRRQFAVQLNDAEVKKIK